MDKIRACEAGGPPNFDPVCGTVVWKEAIDRFFDGDGLYVFCCAVCRRTYIAERERSRNTDEERPRKRPHP